MILKELIHQTIFYWNMQSIFGETRDFLSVSPNNVRAKYKRNE